MGAYLRCSRNKSLFYFWNGLLLCSHRDTQGKHYTLIDMPVHCEQTEPNSVFVACFSHEL